MLHCFNFEVHVITKGCFLCKFEEKILPIYTQYLKKKLLSIKKGFKIAASLYFDVIIRLSFILLYDYLHNVQTDMIDKKHR